MPGVNLDANWLLGQLDELIPPGPLSMPAAAQTTVLVPLLLLVGARNRIAKDCDTLSRQHRALQRIADNAVDAMDD